MAGQQVKFSASAILESPSLVLLRAEASAEALCRLPSATELLSARGINVEFVAFGVSPDGGALLSLAFPEHRMADFERCRGELAAALAPGVLTLVMDVALVGVYGPHFKEKPGILGAFLGGLAESGVTVYAAASSISSLCALIPWDQTYAARAAIQQRFLLPL
jgi:aspartokinase